MREKDELTKHLSPSARIEGPCTNAWQQFTDARTRQTAERQCEAAASLSQPMRDPFSGTVDESWRQRMADHEAVQRHDQHWGRPGGMTFVGGETIPKK